MVTAFQSDIVVLCEHNIFVVSSAGQITFQKRLDYHPACFCTYPVPGKKDVSAFQSILDMDYEGRDRGRHFGPHMNNS